MQVLFHNVLDESATHAYWISTGDAHGGERRADL